MESQSFIKASPDQQFNLKPQRKKTDYWGILFVSIVLFSSASCFILDSYHDHSEKNTSSYLSAENFDQSN